MTPTLAEALAGSPYQGYLYSYPHKTTYRPLDPPPDLGEVWRGEDRRSLSLYVHVPFCEMRCGYCNLFTRAQPESGLVRRWLEALERQAEVVRSCLGGASFARFAVGGGTPTFLEAADLERILDLAHEALGADPASIGGSVETSPETATPDRLRLLVSRGLDRISIGIQSFLEAEAHAAGRPQRRSRVEAALAAIRESGVRALNVDLIYGIPGQTAASWLESIRQALAYRPEELYLYPLYIRPLTGLGRHGVEPSDRRLALYRAGRDALGEAGYAQVSMRMFRARHAPPSRGRPYRCQEDGMVGLGAGARSYTRRLHYSSEYAVDRGEVLAILEDYVDRDARSFATARRGIVLDEEDRRRRYAILSLLSDEGLSGEDYSARFGAAPLEDLPQLGELVEHGLAALEGDRLVLTERGLERSDVIGPWLRSARVRRLMAEYEAR